MEKPTLIGELNKIVEDTNIDILRAKAHAYDAIVDLLRHHDLNQKTDPASLNGYNCYAEPAPELRISPEGPLFTDAQPTINAAPTTPEEPPAAPPVPEEPPAPMPAEDPGPAQRRRGRPRKVIAEEAPSLLPAPKPPTEAEPVGANEPAATPEAEPVAAGDDDLPW